jgi:hypothetical protein
VLGRSSDRLELAVRSLTGNAMDVRTVDAEIVQFAVGHAAKFRDGLTILAPVIERAREVHVKPLSEGFICQQPPIGADLYLMTGIYVAAQKTKTAKFSNHLCGIRNAPGVFDADLPFFGQRIGRMTLGEAIRLRATNGVPLSKNAALSGEAARPAGAKKCFASNWKPPICLQARWGGVAIMWRDGAMRGKAPDRQCFNRAVAQQKRPPGEDPAGVLW